MIGQLSLYHLPETRWSDEEIEIYVFRPISTSDPLRFLVGQKIILGETRQIRTIFTISLNTGNGYFKIAQKVYL